MFCFGGRYDKNDRISFYQNILYGLENYSSSSEEVNALLDKFYDKAFHLKSTEPRFETVKNIHLKRDIKKGKSVIRQLYIGDVMIALIFKFLHEAAVFNTKDELSKLIYEIYIKTDKLIYPYIKGNDSDAEFMYYVEIKYDE